MAQEPRVTPMIHVPNVKATMEWYESIGFKILAAYENDGEVAFAVASYGARWGGDALVAARRRGAAAPLRTYPLDYRRERSPLASSHRHSLHRPRHSFGIHCRARGADADRQVARGLLAGGDHARLRPQWH